MPLKADNFLVSICDVESWRSNRIHFVSDSLDHNLSLNQHNPMNRHLGSYRYYIQNYDKKSHDRSWIKR